MTSDKSVDINEKLRLGIDAARTGREKEAKEHLIAVLKQSPNNIPAMLWLAFVLPSPQDTIRLLKRVLELDPENERAKAGIRWAERRLGREPTEAASVEPALTEPAQPTAASPAPDSTDDFPDDSANDVSIRQQLLSGEIQKQAKKGALAQRARRTINPLLVIIFAAGALGMMSIALGALVFVPPDTLAAWFPAPTESASVDTDFGPIVPVAPPAHSVIAPSVAAKSFTSQADILTVEASQPVEAPAPKTEPMVPPVEAEPPSAMPLPIPAAETNPVPVEPSSLIGPEFPSTEVTEAVPVDNLLLAHQPAYPGEKWIEVNVTTQQVTAWEGDVPVFSFTASTGLPNTPTVLGEFHIYWKMESALMVGPGYYLPEVPYTMYFYGGYALHGTYWHNNFGQPMSHGCVNLETGNAKKLFEWADPVVSPGQTQAVATADNPGTLVVVHQ